MDDPLSSILIQVTYLQFRLKDEVIGFFLFFFAEDKAILNQKYLVVEPKTHAARYQTL